MAVTRVELDEAIAQGCQTPGCDHRHHDILFLHARCHVGGRLEVSYRIGSGILHIACRECGQTVADIKVAK